MAEGEYYFPGVTLMITHYNRSSSLERLLARFRELRCRFDDIVVSDDGSRPEHLNKLKAMQPDYNYRLVTTEKNSGFPGNMNRAQDAVKTPYTLYVQEDFDVKPAFPPGLQDALQFMNDDKALDYIRFWSFYRYPTLKPYGKGFSRIVYSFWSLNHRKFFMYSDNPHLRRSTFFEKFGRYREHIDGNVSEHLMAVSFIKNKGNGLFFEAYDTLFEHRNSETEPSTFDRASWRQSKNPFFRFLRWMYLKYKFARSVWEVRFMKLDN